MKRLKTSRFFSEAPTADERAAVATTDGAECAFDAGIADPASAPQPSMKKKRSLWRLKKGDGEKEKAVAPEPVPPMPVLPIAAEMMSAPVSAPPVPVLPVAVEMVSAGGGREGAMVRPPPMASADEGIVDAAVGAPLPAMKKKKSFWSLSKGEEGDYEKPLPPVPVFPAEILGHEQPMTTVECGGVLDEGTEAPPTTMKKKGSLWNLKKEEGDDEKNVLSVPVMSAADRERENQERLVAVLERNGIPDAHIGAPPSDVKKKKSFWRLKKDEQNEKAVPATPTVPAKFIEEERPVTAFDPGQKVGKESKKAEGLELMATSRFFCPTPPDTPTIESWPRSRAASDTASVPYSLKFKTPASSRCPPVKFSTPAKLRTPVSSRSPPPTISRPMPLHPAYRVPIPTNLTTTPVTQPPGPPPSRPSPVNHNLIEFLNNHGASIVAPPSIRGPVSTFSAPSSSSRSTSAMVGRGGAGSVYGVGIGLIESMYDQGSSIFTPTSTHFSVPTTARTSIASTSSYVSDEDERTRRSKRKGYRNDIPLPRKPGYGQYSRYVSPLYDPAVFAPHTSTHKIDPRTGLPKVIHPRAPYPFTSPQDLPLFKTLWDEGVTSRVERDDDGYFMFIQEVLYPPGPLERYDPKMKDRFAMEGRCQLVNMASDSEKEHAHEDEKGETSEKDAAREKRRIRKQKKMPFGSFVVDTVGGGRKFVRDI